MTEDEAKTKWCPLVRQYHVVDDDHDEALAGYNSFIDGREKDPLRCCSCVASACMMWRWDEKSIDDSTHVSEVEGYCGLAGKP